MGGIPRSQAWLGLGFTQSPPIVYGLCMTKRREHQELGAIAYLRVSTDEQAESGLGLADQQEIVEAEAARRGWNNLLVIADHGYSARNLSRPGISEALELLRTKQAGTLVVSKLDRLSRSLIDFAGLMERARREGWELVVLDLGVDTTTAAGEMVASVMASFAQYERRLISDRTSAALQQLKRQGVRLGRPTQTPTDVRSRIVSERAEGKTLQGIADGLNSDQVPTVRGGSKWYPSTVKAVLTSIELDAAAA